MAFVVLFSTLSFAVNMHYCGDTLVETAMFHKAKGCGMEMQKPSADGCAITKKNCCDDKQLVVDGQDELQLQVDTISLEQQVDVVYIIDNVVKLSTLTIWQQPIIPSKRTNLMPSIFLTDVFQPPEC